MGLPSLNSGSSLIALFASLDWVTDVITIAVVRDWGDPLFTAGFMVFGVAQLWRLGWDGWFLFPHLGETVAHANHRCPPEVYTPLLWCIYWWAGIVKSIVRIVRILLIPIDICARGCFGTSVLDDAKWLCVHKAVGDKKRYGGDPHSPKSSVNTTLDSEDSDEAEDVEQGNDDDEAGERISRTHATDDDEESEETEESEEEFAPWPFHYFHEFGALTGGLRHFALRVAEDHMDVGALAIKTVSLIALVEQVLHNIGGCLISLSVFTNLSTDETNVAFGADNETLRRIVFTSIICTGLSALAETMHFSYQVFAADHWEAKSQAQAARRAAQEEQVRMEEEERSQAMAELEEERRRLEAMAAEEERKRMEAEAAAAAAAAAATEDSQTQVSFLESLFGGGKKR